MTASDEKGEMSRATATWGIAGSTYEGFSAHFADALSHCVQRLAPKADESILDVATGTGWTARLVAARGARVTALDYSEERTSILLLSCGISHEDLGSGKGTDDPVGISSQSQALETR